MRDIYVTGTFPYYQVWVDGKIYEHLIERSGTPLTWSQMDDIAAGYREVLSWYENGS